MISSSEKIHIIKSDHVATITIANPNKRNAMDSSMFDSIKHIFTSINEDKDIWLVIIRGSESGGKTIFSSGIDFMELASKNGASEEEILQAGKKLQDAFNAVENANPPVICVMEGYCLGAGLELALSCDIRIATKDCLIGFPEVQLGIIPDLGGTSRAIQTVGTGNAKRLVLTADNISATEALNMGLITYVTPNNEVDKKVTEVITKLLSNSPVALRRGKNLINSIRNFDQKTSLEYELKTQVKLLNSQDVQEAFIARMEKRKPNWQNK